MADLFVLDTSAWIALDEKEPGADQVESLLADAWLGDVELAVIDLRKTKATHASGDETCNPFGFRLRCRCIDFAEVNSFVTLTELEYVRTQERNAEQAAELLAFARSQPATWHHSDDALCSAAAKLKAAHKISLADSFVAALAQRLNATLVHKDPELDALKGVVKLQALPPKAPAARPPPP